MARKGGLTMECKTARLFLPLQAELGKEEGDLLQGHLNIRPDWDAGARARQREAAHFHGAMNAVPVPVGLRGRILDALAAARPIDWREWLLTRIVLPLVVVVVGILFVVFLVRGLLAPPTNK